MYDLFRQILDLYLDDDDAADASCQLLDIDFLDTFDFEDHVDWYEKVGSLKIDLLDKDSICETGVVVG